jgi:hypothetical protein
VTVAVGLHDQHAVGVVVAGQVDEVAARPELEVGVVGPGLQVAAGHHDRLARELGGQGGAPVGVSRRGLVLGDGQAVVAPAGPHELQELFREVGVV